ncbi:hypothetical protein ACIG56_01015 [Nocardia fusca]|uniref:hypothetical protein n=1 Tax=Nocardia fusca TaxID=941183 RepID=UPI0037C71CBA
MLAPIEDLIALCGRDTTVRVDILIRDGETVGADLIDLRGRYLCALHPFSTRCLGLPAEVVEHALPAGPVPNSREARPRTSRRNSSG